MEVVATKKGFYQCERVPGEKFTVPDGRTASWYTPVEKEKPAKPAPPAKKPEAKPEASKAGTDGSDLA